MIPLTFAEIGKENIIRKVEGNPETVHHLADLGFVVGGTVTAVADLDGNLIVNVKDSRIALGKSMAMKIMV